MKAVVQDGSGEADVLRIAEVPTPEPGPEDLLVRVRCTALNRADILQRRGMYPPPPGDSELLGLEVAGEVAAAGERATGFEPGDRVFGLVGGGGYAEYALLDHRMAIAVPARWQFAEAAAVPEVFLTANETLFVLAGLSEGETVLLHAGGSGVGTAAIQMCRRAGARVLFTAGSEPKIEWGQALGGGDPHGCKGINYHQHDFAREVRRFTREEGVDVILDPVGADYLERHLGLLKTRGRLVVLGLMGGAKTELDLARVLRKRLQIMGSVLRSRSLAEKRQATDRFRQAWWPRIQAGEVRPVIDRAFRLDQVADAHQYMEENRNFGKILLEVR